MHTWFIRWKVLKKSTILSEKSSAWLISSAYANFLKRVFSKMRRQKYYFDFKFEISVKFRAEWCLLIYDSYWICQYPVYFLYIHAYANTDFLENVSKFKRNHIFIHTIRSEILRWFQIWSHNNIFAYAFERKTR